MFRSLFRRSRTVRVPIEHTGHQVREVKIYNQTPLRPSNLITALIVGYFVIRIFDSQVDHKKLEEAEKTIEGIEKQNASASDKQTQGLSEHWKKAHEAIKKANDLSTKPQPQPGLSDMPEDVISTLTLPVWIRSKKSPLYTPDDQEFKDYAKLQSDNKKKDELLTQVAIWGVARIKSPMHQGALRYIGFTGECKFNLQIIPQLHAPPLYEIPAIIVFKDGLGVGWKVLRPDLGGKFEAMFHPSATYAAVTASLRAFSLATYAIVRARLSGTGAPVFVMPGQTAKMPDSIISQKQIEQENATPPASVWGANSQAMQELLKAIQGGQIGQSAKERHSEVVQSLPLSAAVQYAAATFKQKQLIGLATQQMNRARGAVQIRGTATCVGKKGSYMFDVCAVYLPAEDRFLGPLLISQARLIKDYSLAQREEDEKKKKLQESKVGTLAQLSKPTSEIVEISTAAGKPPTGKEEE